MDLQCVLGRCALKPHVSIPWLYTDFGPLPFLSLTLSSLPSFSFHFSSQKLPEGSTNTLRNTEQSVWGVPLLQYPCTPRFARLFKVSACRREWDCVISEIRQRKTYLVNMFKCGKGIQCEEANMFFISEVLLISWSFPKEFNFHVASPQANTSWLNSSWGWVSWLFISNFYIRKMEVNYGRTLLGCCEG